MTRDFRWEPDYKIRDYIQRTEHPFPPRNPLREHPVHRWDRERDVEAAKDELRRREREAYEAEEREREFRRLEREAQEARERDAREAFWEAERLETEARQAREELEYLFRRAAESGRPLKESKSR